MSVNSDAVEVGQDLLDDAASATAGRHMYFTGEVIAFPGGSGGASGGAEFIYWMRGFDTSLASLVYWQHVAEADTTGAFYTGPGPLTNITLLKVLGR